MAEEVKETNRNPEVETNNNTNVNPEGNTNQENNTNQETTVKDGDNNEVNTSDEKKHVTNTNKETDNEIMIPKKRFDEINGKYKTVLKEYESLKGNLQELEQQLKQQQQVTSQNAQAEELQKQVEKYESVISGLVESKINSIPEEYRELVPEGLSKEKKLEWITKAEEKGLFKKKPVTTIIGEPLNHSSDQSDADTFQKMNPLQKFVSFYSSNIK